MLNRRYEDRQLCRFYRRADALFVHSRSQAADLLEFANVDAARVHVVPHGNPYDYGPPKPASKAVLRTQLGLPQDKTVALFFGNIRDEKNLALLMQAASRYKDCLHLVVAGSANVSGASKNRTLPRAGRISAADRIRDVFDTLHPRCTGARPVCGQRLGRHAVQPRVHVAKRRA